MSGISTRSPGSTNRSPTSASPCVSACVDDRRATDSCRAASGSRRAASRASAWRRSARPCGGRVAHGVGRARCPSRASTERERHRAVALGRLADRGVEPVRLLLRLGGLRRGFPSGSTARGRAAKAARRRPDSRRGSCRSARRRGVHGGRHVSRSRQGADVSDPLEHPRAVGEAARSSSSAGRRRCRSRPAPTPAARCARRRTRRLRRRSASATPRPRSSGHDPELVDPARARVVARPAPVDSTSANRKPIRRAVALGDEAASGARSVAPRRISLPRAPRAGLSADRVHRREGRRWCSIRFEPERGDRRVVVRAPCADHELVCAIGYFTTRRSLARIMRRLPDFSPSDQVPVSSSGEGCPVISKTDASSPCRRASHSRRRVSQRS